MRWWNIKTEFSNEDIFYYILKEIVINNNLDAVSYTHLDVYKRQVCECVIVTYLTQAWKTRSLCDLSPVIQRGRQIEWWPWFDPKVAAHRCDCESHCAGPHHVNYYFESTLYFSFESYNLTSVFEYVNINIKLVTLIQCSIKIGDIRKLLTSSDAIRLVK